VRWKKVKGHSKRAGPHKPGNDRADALAVAAKNEADRERRNGQARTFSKAHVSEARQESCTR
jgi:ribonuclease HI